MSKCNSKIVFTDDDGINNCTWICELQEGHSGLCRESGTLGGGKQNYFIEWEKQLKRKNEH